MKNIFLKRVSFLVLGITLALAGAGGAEAGWKSALNKAESMTNLNQSGSLISNASKSVGKNGFNENFVMSKVKSYANPKDHDLLDWLKIENSIWGAKDGFKKATHNEAYNQIKNEINGLKNVSIEDAKKTFSQDVKEFENDISEGIEGLGQTFSADAWSSALDAAKDDIQFGIRELGITHEASQELINQARANTIPEDIAVPTLDVGNIAVGMYNVDSVIETYHYDEDIRDYDTRICAEMGVSGLSGGNVSTGEFCCLLWEESGDSVGWGSLKGALASEMGGGSALAGGIGGGIGAWDGQRLAEKRKREGYDYCCSLSDDKKRGDHHVLCQAESAQKAECLNGELKGGSSAEDAWKKCDIECEGKSFGDLSYNEDGKYDPDKVDKLMKECYKEENKWSPSTTVPTSSELAPVIPEVAKKGVTGN